MRRRLSDWNDRVNKAVDKQRKKLTKDPVWGMVISAIIGVLAANFYVFITQPLCSLSIPYCILGLVILAVILLFAAVLAIWFASVAWAVDAWWHHLRRRKARLKKRD